MKRACFLGALAIMSWMSTGLGGEIDFKEDFALSADRAAVLKQLIPGTEDYYYYHALHYMHTEQFAKVEELLQPWVQRFKETPRYWEVRTRLALLTYDKDPKKTIDYLRGRLNLHYPHAQEQLNAVPNFPIAVDPAQISRDAFAARARGATPQSTDSFEDSALDWLIATQLTPEYRRSLLSRLQRPDYDKLPQMIVDDLNHPNSGGFGSFNIHRQLLLSQLEELLTLKPDLLNQQHFVTTYLTRLQPTADDNWRRDPVQLAAYLARVDKFAQRLAPVHNTLKAHVIYHQLVLGRMQGKYDKERFLAYLKLPRMLGYVSKAMLENEDNRRFACNLGMNYDNATLLAPIGDDEPIVRSYLAHFLVDAKTTAEFEPYINDIYLKHLFAEVKIVNGLGEPEQWASLLPPALFQQLKERVDIDFVPTNKLTYAPDEPVALELFVKNVNTLIVKVFEINAKNFYRTQQREIDTDINLDGLVANVEQTYTYTDPPLKRVGRKFAFPELNKPGIYVVDFIGNGRSSRALIRKGQLKPIIRTTGAGQAFSILDQTNKPVANASLWLAGHEYQAEKDGTIFVPFSTNPTRQAVVLSAKTAGGNEYSSLTHFQHEAENYQLQAGFYVDREHLLQRKTAKMLLRTSLTVNGVPVSVKLLEEVKLVISSTDLDGIASSQEIPNVPLYEDRETTHEFQVPARLAAISFTITAKVKKVSAGDQKIDLAAGDSFTLNNIDRTEKVEDLHLVQADGKYFVELRGKTGEIRPGRPVTITFKHRHFKHQFAITLKTDPNGRVTLGQLTDIATITAQGPEGTAEAWALPTDGHTYPSALHGTVGQTLVLPYLPTRNDQSLATAGKETLTRGDVSLLELRGESFTADRFEHVKLANGLLQFEKLPAGDFDLYLKGQQVRIRLRITQGEQISRFAVGAIRQLETKPLKPLQIAAINMVPAAAAPKKEGEKPEEKKPSDKLVIQIANSNKLARVHVFGTRMMPIYSAYGKLSAVRDVEPSYYLPGSADSVYLTGRNIGDEYRYIIDRKYAKKFPGNTLDRPSLLLNPWAVRETETGEQVAQGGDEFRSANAKQDAAGGRGAAQKPGDSAGQGNFSNLDFLALQSAVLLNLVPDEKGNVEIDRDQLAGHQQLRIVAVDPINTTSRNYSLPEGKPLIIDLRLANGLDPAGHFTQQKQITVIPAGQKFTLHDIATSKFELYDSLPRVYNLYGTLNRDPKLVEFSFILGWPKLKDEEKRALYSKHASHELSFFLFKKDPAFFQAVIVPYLKNKKDKTFFDHFLLEDDLRPYLEPWRYGQLNMVERILLTRRIAEERPHTSRHVTDLYQLLPPNLENFIRLFDTAVQRSALETGDSLGLASAIEAKYKNNLKTLAEFGVPMPAGAAAPAASPAPPAPPGAPAADAPARERAEMFRRSAGENRKELEQMEKQLQATNGLAAAKKAARDGRADEKAKDRAGAALGDSDKDALFFDAEGAVAGKRQAIRQLYRRLEKTKEWAENNYHHLTIDQQHAGLVTVNAFWKDFAQHDPAQPFYSRNLAEASRNFPEMLLALAVLDLPFEPAKHDSKFEGTEMTLIPGGPAVVFHEEVRPSAAPEAGAKVLVSQNFYRQNDRYRQENGEQFDKFITEEFLTHVVYGCQVVVTNPTSTRQKLNVLVQIPQGALPVLNSKTTKTVHMTLEPYHTQTLDYHFYFAAPGKFNHFPVHVARNETLIAAAAPVVLSVVEKPTKVDTDSWDYISQHGTTEQVLAYLDKNNVAGINLDRIAWRMKDAKVFASVIARLVQRHQYNHTLWSYSLLHNVVPAANEFLKHTDQTVNECGGRLKSTLLTVDLVERRTVEHLEYKPLVNARTHALGKRRQIVNDRFFQQYNRFLKELTYQPTLTDTDWLAVTYYYLLQDRVEDALASFAKVNAKNVTTQLQYDYCAAYLAFFTEERVAARAIAVKYVNHPVDRWKNTFAAITAQLDEADGKKTETVDKENREQQQTNLAATEPSLDIVVEAKQIKIDYQNLKQVRINFYEMDVELLFSRNPFVQQFQGEFSSIKANQTLTVDLPADKRSHLVPLPPKLLGKNVIVEVEGAGKQKTQAYYAHNLAVQVIENYGQVKVTHQTTGKPVAKAYVKVYAQTQNGQVKFFKDGYTDLRGRFDYASLNTNDLDAATKFSVLILSDEHGALVREATPPKQ